MTHTQSVVFEMDLPDAQERIAQLMKGLWPVGPELPGRVVARCRIVRADKKQFLLRMGDVARSVYFVLKGGVRIYSIGTEGNEVTSWLLFEDEIALSVYSFFSQKPAFETIETVEPSVLLRLDYGHLQSLYREFPEFNAIGRLLTEQYHIRSEARTNALRRLSARERYIDLLENRPQLLLRSSLGHIASYLGVAPATLSRIRASI